MEEENKDVIKKEEIDKKFDNNESFESAGYRETTVEGLDDDSNIAD